VDVTQIRCGTTSQAGGRRVDAGVDSFAQEEASAVASDIKIVRPIADPGTTAIWEQALDMVQSGEMSLDEFVAKQSAWMSKQVQRCAGLRLTISGPASPAGRGGAPWKKRKAGKPKAAAAKRARKPA
jgi:hypothetical protein